MSFDELLRLFDCSRCHVRLEVAAGEAAREVTRVADVERDGWR